MFEGYGAADEVTARRWFVINSDGIVSRAWSHNANLSAAPLSEWTG